MPLGEFCGVINSLGPHQDADRCGVIAFAPEALNDTTPLIKFIL
jgi:hypothetical protein